MNTGIYFYKVKHTLSSSPFESSLASFYYEHSSLVFFLVSSKLFLRNLEILIWIFLFFFTSCVWEIILKMDWLLDRSTECIQWTNYWYGVTCTNDSSDLRGGRWWLCWTLSLILLLSLLCNKHAREREFYDFRSNKRAFPYNAVVDDDVWVCVGVRKWTDVQQWDSEIGEMKKINK